MNYTQQPTVTCGQEVDDHRDGRRCRGKWEKGAGVGGCGTVEGGSGGVGRGCVVPDKRAPGVFRNSENRPEEVRGRRQGGE